MQFVAQRNTSYLLKLFFLPPQRKMKEKKQNKLHHAGRGQIGFYTTRLRKYQSLPCITICTITLNLQVLFLQMVVPEPLPQLLQSVTTSIKTSTFHHSLKVTAILHSCSALEEHKLQECLNITQQQQLFKQKSRHFLKPICIGLHCH